MLRSLYSGVAGLKTHQIKMDVIGNNIANVNTYAFKGSRVTFKDVFYQTSQGASDAGDDLGGSNTSQIGYGSMVGTIDVLHTRAGFTPTGSSMDVFVEGEGYLIAQDGSGNETYTRVGNTKFDGSGNLVDGNGRYICGYPIKRDAAGNIVYKENTPVSGKGNAGGLNFDFGTMNGAKLNDYNIKYTTGVAPATTGASIDGKTITITFVPAPANSAAGATTAKTALDALFTALNDPTNVAPVPPLVGTIYYDKTFPTINLAGVLVTEVVAGGPMDLAQVTTIAGGVDQFTKNPIVDTAGDPRPIKLPGTTSRPDVNGVPTYEEKDVASFTNMQIGADGIIRGTSKDGTVVQLGQIALASIPNPGAMALEGSSYFKAGANTGTITYATPGDKLVGAIKSGGLEMSNVDLSTEFADMITTQRGFQANSRIITVGDEMLQELVSMKR